MSNAIALNLGGEIANPAFGRLYDYEGLTDGSLALLDFTASDFPSGVPANGATMPNFAASTSAEILGAADVAFTFLSTFTASEALFERTSAGGLHGAVSQTSQGGHLAGIELAAPIRAHLNNVDNHSRTFFLSLWTNTTRISAVTTNVLDYEIANAAAAASNYLFLGSIQNVLGLARKSVSRTWTGNQTSTPTLQSGRIFAWGNTPAYNGIAPNAGKSAVLYRAHLIDATAAGLTTSEIEAADLALYARRTAAGGRLYGDTYAIDPASLG